MFHSKFDWRKKKGMRIAKSNLLNVIIVEFKTLINSKFS
jgi:hypothetical protein